MNFVSYLSEILLEGGFAIKSSSPITQQEAKKLIPEIKKKIMAELEISKDEIRQVGSAGKKHSDETSGDIDFIVSATKDQVGKTLPRLSSDYKIMTGINVFSFGYKNGDKIAQIDIMPVENLDFAEWAFVSDKKDLDKGYKGATRNEVMFAVCRYADQKNTKDGDEVVERERYFFDLNRGLFRGTQSRKSKKGLKKNFSTVEKEFMTDDPQEIVNILFGDFDYEKMLSFDELWAAVNSDKFKWKDSLEDIKKLTKEGIKNKKLKMPSDI